jgi:hypothetical protein
MDIGRTNKRVSFCKFVEEKNEMNQMIYRGRKGTPGVNLHHNNPLYGGRNAGYVYTISGSLV